MSGYLKHRPLYKKARWRRLRTRILSRDGYRCVECSSRRRLEVHHRRPVISGGDFWSESNLETRCKPCHQLAHNPISPAQQAWTNAVRELQMEIKT